MLSNEVCFTKVNKYILLKTDASCSSDFYTNRTRHGDGIKIP